VPSHLPVGACTHRRRPLIGPSAQRHMWVSRFFTPFQQPTHSSAKSAIKVGGSPLSSPIHTPSWGSALPGTPDTPSQTPTHSSAKPEINVGGSHASIPKMKKSLNPPPVL
jgi:hypothetical protein